MPFFSQPMRLNDTIKEQWNEKHQEMLKKTEKLVKRKNHSRDSINTTLFLKIHG